MIVVVIAKRRGVKWGFSWHDKDLRQVSSKVLISMILTITTCHDLAGSIVVYISGNYVVYTRPLSPVRRAPFLS
jgi:hypothetical protein